jgi:tetratricopeptide (TPR) repeat protein
LSQQLVLNLENKAKAMATVAGLYAKNGRKDKALETLSQAFQIVERIEDIYGSREALAAISFKYVELGADSPDWLKMESMISRLKSLAPLSQTAQGLTTRRM